MKKILIATLCTLFLTTGCGSQPTSSATSTPSASAATSVATSISETAPDASNESTEAAAPIARDNSSAKLTTLFAGKFTVGEDVPAGRYLITGKGTGNLFIYDGELPTTAAILDDGSLGMAVGVPSVTTDLKDGQGIEISGINEVIFTPAETAISNTLSSGDWVVGLDVEPGKFNVTCKDGESGNFFVMDGKLPVTSEILDKSDLGIGVEQIRVELKSGQQVKITGLSEVTFEAV